MGSERSSIGSSEDEVAKDPRRKRSLQILMTAAERVELDAAAHAAGMPTGTFIRTVALREARRMKRPRASAV